MYKVLLVNDDHTPMEFVVDVLERIFDKSHEEAVALMLAIHKEGFGLCGPYSRELAQSKVAEVIELSRQQQHSLQCKLAKE